MKRLFSVFASVLCILCGCSREASVTAESFGTLSTGEEVTLWHMVNSNGASMDVTDYGCRIVRICMPGRDGRMDDVVVGYGDLESFEKKDRFIGPVIGRFGNRIDHAAFTLDGVRYEVDANEKFGGEPVQCHGGRKGFDKFVWEGEAVVEPGRVGVRFHRLSPDGEQGFPGNMDAYVTYWLTDDNVVRLEYDAVTDKPTVVNLSNHTYFNLKGYRAGNVIDHIFMMDADSCIVNNRQSIPDSLMAVEGTPFDFRQPNRFDYRMTRENAGRVRNGSWVVNDWDGSLKKIADLYAPDCGRGVEVWSTEPNLVTETCGSVDGTVMGKGGRILQQYDGMLLETIHMADSPNQSRFPSTLLRPGEKYHSETQYRFYTR